MARRLVLSLTLLISLLTPSAALACRGADATPAQQGPRAAAAATLCLVNAERTSRGLARLAPDHHLGAAARGHVADMLRHRYFAHDSRDGRSAVERIRDAGYRRGAARILGGENLAWGRDRDDTPRSVVSGWIASPKHHRTMFFGRFRYASVAVGTATPVAVPGSTYGMSFGA